MRKLVGVALLALAAAFLLLIPQAESVPQIGGSQDFSALSLRVRSAWIADAQGGKVAVLPLVAHPKIEGEIAAFCAESPIQQNFLVLQHASVPGVGESLAEAVAKELSACGFSSRSASLEDAMGAENSVIIAPTGALPEGLANGSERLAKKNNRLVVLQSLAGRQISQEGEISGHNLSDWFEAVPLRPQNEREAARMAARASIVPSGANLSREFLQAGNATIIVRVDGKAAYCRAVLVGEGRCRAADSGKLVPDAGKLLGPGTLVSSEEGVFEFSLGNDEEVGRELRFFAVAYLNGEEAQRDEISGGRISEGWASSFPIAINNGGKHVVRVLDQFSRPHASAYLEVAGLQAIPVSQQGERFEFRLFFGGKPAEGKVRAWIDGGEGREYFASNGTLVIHASPKAGKHSMNFEHGGASSQVPFEFYQNGLAETYLRLIIPAALFLFAVFILLRGPKKPTCCITFPEFAQERLEELEASEGQLVRAWKMADRKNGGHRLPCYAEEIGDAFVEGIGKRGKLAVDQYSTSAALRQLVSKGAFAEHMGLFIPCKETEGFSGGQLFCLRQLHGCMLGRGLKFKRGRVVRVEGCRYEFMAFSSGQSVLAGIGKKDRAIIFDSEKARSDFIRSLRENCAENTRIKLALSLGKLRLFAANGMEMGEVLP
jgi:hypothetical protein